VPGMRNDYADQLAARFGGRLPLEKMIDSFGKLFGIARVPRSCDRRRANIHAGILGVNFSGGEFLLKGERNFSEQQQTGKADDAYIHKQEHRQQQPLARGDGLDGTEQLGRRRRRGRRVLGRSFRRKHLLPKIVHAVTS
jgi:hypothetical protein